MPYEYTRQRQGRDFSKHEDDKKSEETKQSMTQRLEHYKEESERNTVPIDGQEPSERKGLQK